MSLLDMKSTRFIRYSEENDSHVVAALFNAS